jgi:hypothetical protein
MIKKHRTGHQQQGLKLSRKRVVHQTTTGATGTVQTTTGATGATGTSTTVPVVQVSYNFQVLVVLVVQY